MSDELFLSLYRAVALLEPPEGSGLDDVLNGFQAQYDELASPPEVIVMRRKGKVTVHCPHCGGQEFYEVDISERWNPMELNVVEPDVLPYFFATSAGKDGDGYQTDHYLCANWGCNKRVDLPEWLESEWT